jgi:hypothetical protein
LHLREFHFSHKASALVSVSALLLALLLALLSASELALDPVSALGLASALDPVLVSVLTLGLSPASVLALVSASVLLLGWEQCLRFRQSSYFCTLAD